MKDIGIPFKVTVGSKITGTPSLQVKVIISNKQIICNIFLKCHTLLGNFA